MSPKRLMVLMCVAFAMLALSACAETKEARTSSDGPSSKSSEDGSGESEKKDGCGSTATDDCAPHVGSAKSVRVDALIWRVTSARTTDELGDQQYGLGAKASGVFLVLKLKVRSDRNESATLTDDVIKLDVDGNTYDTDNDGTVAAIGTGDESFLLETIGPDSSKSGTVVFDVPKKVLSQKMELRFGELGSSETHGYIRVPSLS